MHQLIKNSLQEAADKLQQFISHPSTVEDIARAAQAIAESLKQGNKVISCGNGGSLCDATHFAEELTGRYRKNRQPLPGIAINDPAYFTCVGNDFSFNDIFARYVAGVGQAGDVLLGISTSGSSANVLLAVEEAKRKDMKTIALTCDSDNKLRQVADIAICAPASAYSDRVQEIHIKVIHILIQAIEQLTGGES